jgi:hypothetical protein
MPVAVTVACAPGQTEAVADTVSVGVGVTETVVTAVFEQVVTGSVPVQLYIVVLLGQAVTTEPVVGLNPVVGDHV